MRAYKIGILTVLAIFLGVVNPVQAGPVVVNDPLWYEFQFGAPTGFALACTSCTPSGGGNSQFADSPAWTFTGAATLTVVDAFLSVDQFRIYDNAVLIGTTSAPTPDTSPTTSDPVVALANLDYSRGIFGLGPGGHSITIEHIAGQSGAAYFRASVPEPTILLLLGAGLVGLVGLRKKFKK